MSGENQGLLTRIACWQKCYCSTRIFLNIHVLFYEGRLWIHAASKVPDSDTIKAMENFYREIYAVNGIADLKFPEHYPVSRLLGCIEVVGCVKCEELACWKEVPEGVRLEAQTEFCWLCEQPQKLIIPFEMRGYQRIYNLERKIYEAAVRGLRPVQAPLPVKFLLPEPQDPLSLKPGLLVSCFDGSKAAEDKKPEGLLAAIAGARAAATQFSKNDNHQSITMQGQDADVSTRTREESEEFEKLDRTYHFGATGGIFTLFPKAVTI
ncbi:unnamed protein product, partial [Vitis vinifera]